MRKSHDIYDRLLDFGIRIVKICRIISKNFDCRVIADQLIRSGTSVGANMQEADSASSLKDFIHKVTIAKKEIQETNYWLKIIKGSDLINHEKNIGELDYLLSESDQLVKIIGSILAKTKANKNI
ncbi:MAG: four helix bundle protein [Candidatus Margulisiibacteriota bacterium]